MLRHHGRVLVHFGILPAHPPGGGVSNRPALDGTAAGWGTETLVGASGSGQPAFITNSCQLQRHGVRQHEAGLRAVPRSAEREAFSRALHGGFSRPKLYLLHMRGDSRQVLRRLRLAAALGLGAVATATGLTCVNDTGPGYQYLTFSVFGRYTGSSGEPLEGMYVEAWGFECVAHCSQLDSVEWERRVSAHTTTDADGRYALEWPGTCLDGNPSQLVSCIPPMGTVENCDAQVRCTTERQERNCTITQR